MPLARDFPEFHFCISVAVAVGLLNLSELHLGIIHNAVGYTPLNGTVKI